MASCPGRPTQELVPIYYSYQNIEVSTYDIINEHVCVSKVKNLSLSEYVRTRKYVCSNYHKVDCSTCTPMITAAELVLTNSVCTLSEVFKTVFSGVTYSALHAKRRLLQMPLVTILLGDYHSGHSKTLLMEYYPNVNYLSLRTLLGLRYSPTVSTVIKKKDLHELLNLAQSNRERETLKCAVYKTSGLTPTAARKHLGLDNMKQRAANVQDAIQQITDIHNDFDRIIKARVESTLGFMSSDEYDTEGETEMTSEAMIDKETTCKLDSLLRDSLFNWFQFRERALKVLNVSEDLVTEVLDTYHKQNFDALTEKERKELEISFDAFQKELRFGESTKRQARALNGEIVTDTESDDPDTYLTASTVKELDVDNSVISKKVTAIKRQVKRQRAKYIEKQHFLSRRKSKALKNIAVKFPHIGTEIEKYVESCNVGADAWRRTGVLTFDGNKKIGKKCTYKRIQQHLQELYKEHFSYGTVVQLCVCRNKRRLSAKRYHGLAQVTSRRARKGFQLRYNPDHHWSAAFYRNLNALQYTNGTDILNINRDDQAGFRLDTLTTHHQYSSPVVKGKDLLTTHTDYVNKYPSVLQTTSYNFSGTKCTDEYCAGVTKAQSLFTKCPAQHATDLQMLSKKDELKSAFYNPVSNAEKAVDCIRVDGAGDEGPGHEEVQFFWTEWHVSRKKIATLVTTRSSGSSYMNRVELQNGCLTRAHSNLFIPSTIHGSCLKANGKTDKSVLHKNLDSAIDIYIQRCNGCSCGKASLHLFKGVQADYEKRLDLIVFLKGSKKKKKELQRKKPELYSYFSQIWNIRNCHMVTGLPSQYVFYLRCCLSKDCAHPLCSTRDKLPDWYSGGPPLSFLPLPLADPDRPHGSTDCTDCKGVCNGHYMKPDQHFRNIESKTRNSFIPPPSQVINEEYKAHGKLSETRIEDLAKRVLLPKEEVVMWIEHLTTVTENRKQGAIKAAATRRAKSKQETETLCKVCGRPWQEETNQIEDWIQCELCEHWFHWECASIEDEPETFLCVNCS